MLEKEHRRHEVSRKSMKNRLKQTFDQPHIVKVRQPRHRDARRLIVEVLMDVRRVVEHIPVRDHDAFGHRCRTGGVLEEREAGTADGGGNPVSRWLGTDRVHGVQAEDCLGIAHCLRKHCGGQRDVRPGVSRYRFDPVI